MGWSAYFLLNIPAEMPFKRNRTLTSQEARLEPGNN